MKIAIVIDNHRRLREGKEPIFPCSDIIELKAEDLDEPERVWLAEHLRFSHTGVAYCLNQEGLFPFLVDALCAEGLRALITQSATNHDQARDAQPPKSPDPRRERLLS
jgi:hypothetical protein